jgi:hypothetical protein
MWREVAGWGDMQWKGLLMITGGEIPVEVDCILCETVL